MNFKTSIENSPQLQLDFLICEFLHKTPAEVRELEKIYINSIVMYDDENIN